MRIIDDYIRSVRLKTRRRCKLLEKLSIWCMLNVTALDCERTTELIIVDDRNCTPCKLKNQFIDK